LLSGDRFVILGNKNHFGIGKIPANNSCRRQSVHLRHVDVHQDDLRTQSHRFLNRFDPIPGFAADLPIGLRFNESSRSAPEQLMIIGDQKLDGTHLLTPSAF